MPSTILVWALTEPSLRGVATLVPVLQMWI